MTTNGESSIEDTEMADCDREKVVTMVDVLKEQQDFEEDANAVLGASDDKNCTYSKGYVKRQAIYACKTCCAEAKDDPSKRAGVCLACSLMCHENHELIELYTKRNFRCDCGNPKFKSQPCQFTPNKNDLNDNNVYNQNFYGIYCTCHKPYPDPDCTEEDDMIQCIICEDWYHSLHLESLVPAHDHYAEMICKGCMEKNPFLYDYSDLAVNNENSYIDVVQTNGSITENSIVNGDTNLDETNISAEVEMNESGILDEMNESSNNTTKKKLENFAETNISADVEMNESGILDKSKESSNDTSKEKLENEQTDNENHYSDIIPEQYQKLESDLQSETATVKIDVKESTGGEDISNEIIRIPSKETSSLAESTLKENVTDSVLDGEVAQTQEVNDLDAEKMEEDLLLADETSEEDKLQNNIVYKHYADKNNKIDENVTDANYKIDENVTDDHLKTDENVVDENNKIDDNLTDENNKVNENVTDENNKIDENVTDENNKVNENVADENNKIDENVIDDNIKIKECLTDESNKIDENVTSSNTQSENTAIEIEKDDLDKQHSDQKTQNEIPEKDVIESKQITNDESSDVNNPIEKPTDPDEENEDLVRPEQTTKEENNIENETQEMEDEIGNTSHINTDSPKIIDAILNEEPIEKLVENNLSQEQTQNLTKDEANCFENVEKSKEVIESSLIDNKSINDNINTSNSVQIEVTENKRKLSTEEQDVSVKKVKLNEENLCVRPKRPKAIHKGATFWPSNFRQKLCTCNECLSMYRDLSVLFLIDPEDTVSAYEYLGQAKEGKQSQYEKGLEALSSLDRIQQINALTEYNKMRDKLLDFLKSFKDRQVVVKEEDIKAFFAEMKPKREPDGVYFCR